MSAGDLIVSGDRVRLSPSGLEGTVDKGQEPREIPEWVTVLYDDGRLLPAYVGQLERIAP